MRAVGDTVFAIGAVAFVWFTIDLIVRKPKPATIPVDEGHLVEA